MNLYTLVYFTGHGIKEVWSHTIKTYPISVRALSLKEAIPKLLKKASSAYRYNNCFKSTGRVPIRESVNKTETIGVLWLEDESVIWEGEKIYQGLQSFDHINPPYFLLPTTEYKYCDNNWIKNYCIDSKFASFEQIFKYIWKRFNGDRAYFSTYDTREVDLKRYFFDAIKNCLKNNIIPQDEIECVSRLLNSKSL